MRKNNSFIFRIICADEFQCQWDEAAAQNTLLHSLAYTVGLLLMIKNFQKKTLLTEYEEIKSYLDSSIKTPVVPQTLLKDKFVVICWVYRTRKHSTAKRIDTLKKKATLHEQKHE